MEDKLQIYYKILCINKESFSNIAELLHTDEFSVCNLDKNAKFSFICDNSALYISLFHHSHMEKSIDFRSRFREYVNQIHQRLVNVLNLNRAFVYQKKLNML